MQYSSSSRSTTSSPGSTTIPDLNSLRGLSDNRTPEEIAKEARELIEVGLQLLAQTPPEVGIRRTLVGVQAILRTTRDLVQKFQGRGRAPTAEELLEEAPETLRTLFGRLGATYIKLGQFVASSPTLFPPEYVQEFQKCLDDAEPVPFAGIKKVIEEDLGQGSLTSVFSFVDETPLATASIAQVHAARLITGEDVVIKVQKPGVEELLTADLAFVYFATKVLEFLNPDFRRISLGDITGDIRTTMLDELDFYKEAKNMGEFRSFLASSNINGVMCPQTYPEASGKRVLTMERLYGKPLVDLDAIRAYTASPEQTLITALNTWMASVVGCSTFHADVHAGNLLVLQDGRIAFIDFGIVGQISPRTWQAVEGLSQGLVVSDYNMMAQALVRLGATSDNVDTVSFAADLKRVVERIERLDVDVVVASSGDEVSARLQADDEEVTQILLDLVAVGQSYGIKFPRDFGLLVKQALYFDRYTKLLAPDVDPLRDERIRSGMKRMADQTDMSGDVIDV